MVGSAGSRLTKEERAAVRALRGLRRRLMAYGFVFGFGLLAVAGALYVGAAGLVGWLVQRFVPGLSEFPVLPSVMVLVGSVLLVVDVWYTVIRSGRLERMIRDVHHQSVKWVTPNEENAEIDPIVFRHAGRGFASGYLAGFLGGMLVFHSLYAAAVSWGLSQMMPDMALFASGNGQGFLAHFVFWLAVPFDLFLLEAPSTFGFNPSPLQPNPGLFGFLLAVFAFKTLLVASVVRLVLAALRYDPDEEGAPPPAAETPGAAG